MIVENFLNATQVRSELSQFIDNVVHEKPQAVKRNSDIFWSISQSITSEILETFTLNMEYEQEEDGSFVGSLLPIQDIIAYGESYEALIEDAAIQLIDYSNDYYREFAKYHNAPNRKAHLPYVLNVLTQEDIDGVKRLIHG